MDETSFKNGFICGMASKGLIRSGELYKPTIYNDSGVYTYFYIDFRRTLQTFSIGMLLESIIVYDSAQISIKGFEKVNETIYKIYATIAGLPHGITVINKKTSRLKFANGEALPPFSTHMFISGQSAYIDGGYYYERDGFIFNLNSAIEIDSTSLCDAIVIPNLQESWDYICPFSVAVDTPTIVLT